MENNKIKTLLDIVPIIIFFAAYKISGIYIATVCLAIITVITTIISYVLDKKVNLVPLLTTIIIVIMASLTVIFKNDYYIKMKPTLINLLFAAILAGGLVFNKIILKSLLNKSLEMADKAWKILTYRWIGLLIFLAITNEIVWRNFSTDIWVNFKVFGILGITFIFMAFQYKFLRDNAKITQ